MWAAILNPAAQCVCGMEFCLGLQFLDFIWHPCMLQLPAKLSGDLSPKWQEGKQMGLQNQEVCGVVHGLS